MSIYRFLILAEQGGFLDKATATKLRAKIKNSDRPISLEELTAWLIKRGMLTAFQAEKLASDSSDSEDSTFRLGPSQSSDTKKSLELLDGVDDDRYTLLDARQVDLNRPASRPESQRAYPLKDDVVPPISLDGLDAQRDFEMPVADPSGGAWLRMLRSLVKRAPRRGQRWDSSLMLAGGGGLLALLLVGVFLYFVLSVGSGDEVFQLAEDDYNGGLYAQAIQKFERFVQHYPKHGKASLARVRIGLARMRTDVEAGNWPESLATVKRELEVIRPEASFDAARSELAGILPEIYDGFVQRARDADDTDEKERFLDQGNEALAMIENPDNLPASLRRQIQGRVDGIRDKSEQNRREIARRRDIARSIKEIQQAVANSDSAAAYRIRDLLLEQHPGAAKDPELQTAVAAISSVERQNVRVIEQPVVAASDERELPGFRAIPLVMRTGGTADELARRIVAVNARGALYGLDGATGRVLWRRWVGFETELQPVRSSPLPDADVLIVDQRFGELLCIHPQSGQLKWRVEVGRPAGPPVVAGDYLLQAATDGTLFSIKAADGLVNRRVNFPQKLSSPPTVGRSDGKVFQPASHSTLYILDAESLACTRTVYTGHLEGMVTVPPVVAGDLIVVLENSGTDYCLLHVLVRKQDGDLVVSGEPIRLRGIVVDPPLTYGRTVVVATDRGAVYVMEAEADNPAEPLRVFAQVQPRTDRTASHFVQLSQNRIFVAGWGLAEFEILAARGTLERRWGEHVEDSHFVTPALFGDTIVTARWSPLTRDVIVEAARLPAAGQRTPELLWQSNLAAQPAAPPLVMPDRSVLLVGRNGALWRIDRDNFNSPIVESNTADMRPVGELLMTKAGAYVYTTGDDRPQWMFAENEAELPRLVLLSDTVRRRLDTAPVLLADGMLLCAREGPVFYVNPSTGRPLGVPLPWPASFSPGARWRTPAVWESGFAILANSQGILQRLEVAPNDSQLVATKTADLKSGIRGNPVVVGPHLYLVTRESAHDSLRVLSSDSLLEIANFPLAQRAVDPIYVIGDQIILQTGTKMVVFRHAEKSWEAPLEFGLLAGAPAVAGKQWLCTARDGHLIWIDPASGNPQPQAGGQAVIDVGQALGVSATAWGRTVLAAGHDSTLHVIPIDSGGDTP